MEDKRTIADLVQKAQEGSHAFEELMKLLDNRVFSYVHGRIQNRDEALIVTQDVFIDLWKALATFTYTGDAQFYAFVFTIVRRHIIKKWRARKHESIEEMYHLKDDTEHFDENYDVVREKVNALDALSRDIITLRHWSELSFAEIAATLRLKEDAVRQRHHRALKKLQDLVPMYE